VAADVETDALDDKADVVGGLDEIDGLAGRRAELARQFDH
jgi:hypothetical protein